MRVADPALNSYFILELGSVWEAEFQECTGLESQNELVYFEEGGENTFTYWFRGKNKNPNLVLKHGVSKMSPSLWAWREAVIHRKVPPLLDGAVILMSAAGKELVRWSFKSAMPVKWQGPELKAGQDQLAIETLELTYEDLRVKVGDTSAPDEPAIKPPELPPAEPPDTIKAAFSLIPQAVQAGSGKEVQFSDQSVSSSEITRWEWSCTALGWTATEQHPTGKFEKEGKWQIKLKVTNAKGKSDSTSQNLIVYPAKKEEEKDDLHVSFTVEPERLNEWEDKEFEFKDTSVSTSPLKSWKWTGEKEGWSDTVQHPKKKFAKPGPHEVLLVATNEKGKVGQAKRTVVVIPDSVEADFEIDPPEIDEWDEKEVKFTDKSTSRSALKTWVYEASSADWTASEQHPKAKFTGKPGRHEVVLTATNSTNKKGTTRKPLLVKPDSLDASLEIDPERIGEWEETEVKFIDKSTSRSPLKTWKWEAASAGFSASEQNPSSKFTEKPGRHEVKLQVTNSSGKSDQATGTLVVVPDHIKADFDYTPTRVEAKREVTLTDRSTTGSPIQKWEWSCPANKSWKSTEQNPKITFEQGGDYVVTLKVTNKTSKSATTQEKIKVEAACPEWPNLHFTAVHDTKLWNNYTFEISQRNGPGGENIAFSDWDFGEQHLAAVRFQHQQVKTVHSFPESGEYLVWFGVRLQGHEDCWYVMECRIMVINPNRPKPELAGKTATEKKKSTIAKKVPYDSPEGSLLKKHME